MRSGLITHADKVLFAERGETQGDLADHSLRVRQPLLRATGGRRWDGQEVGPAAGAAAREVERRRPDLIPAAWWKEERGERVFVDYNQNAPQKTVCGAWAVRARRGAQVSTPVAWAEIDDIHP